MRHRKFAIDFSEQAFNEAKRLLTDAVPIRRCEIGPWVTDETVTNEVVLYLNAQQRPDLADLARVQAEEGTGSDHAGSVWTQWSVIFQPEGPYGLLMVEMIEPAAAVFYLAFDLVDDGMMMAVATMDQRKRFVFTTQAPDTPVSELMTGIRVNMAGQPFDAAMSRAEMWPLLNSQIASAKKNRAKARPQERVLRGRQNRGKPEHN